MWDKTITIFCKKQSALGDTWYPYVIKGVDANTDTAWLIRNYGENTTASLNLHIPCVIEGDTIKVAQYKYLPPLYWESKGVDVIRNVITFRGGEDFCIILIGDYGFTEPILDDEYRLGFLQHLKGEFDGVYVVTRANLHTLIPHFELVGR